MSKSEWLKALEAASRARKRNQNGTVLVLGSPGCGKSTLIRGLQRYAAGGADRLRPDEAYFNTGGASIVDTAALPVRASTDVSGDFTYQTCALLVLQNPAWSDICGSTLRRRWIQCGVKGTTLLVIVSLSDMLAAYEEASKWLKFASNFLPDQVQKTELEKPVAMSESFLESYADLRENTKILLATRRKEKQTFQSNAAAATPPKIPDAQSSEIDEDIVNLGIQVVVCCCKADMLPSVVFSGNSEKLNEELIFIAYMRELCRQYGASLLFLNAEDDDNSNQARLNSLITSPITKENVPPHPTLNTALALYVPAGWDSKHELQQMAKPCGVSSLSVPLQTLIKKTYGDEDITSKLEEKNRDIRIAVPPSFDQFLKSIAAKSDSELPGPIETFKIVRVLEGEGRKAAEDIAKADSISRVESVSKIKEGGPASPPTTTGTPVEKQTSRKNVQETETSRPAARGTRDKAAVTIRSSREDKDARKGGSTLISSLLSDFKKTKGSDKRG